MIKTSKEIHRFQKNLMKWYGQNQRKLPWRDSDDPYYIWLSEVMLQQTQVKTALPYYFKFLSAFPTINDLASSDLGKVLKMWEGLGYYARARNFHKAAGIVVEKYGCTVPDNFEDFIQLPGVGDYIGSAVQSLAYGHPFAVVDGNVKRVLARLFCFSNPVNKASSHKIFKKQAQKLLDQADPGTFNQAVMELGAMVCTPKKAKCLTCPVSEFCKSLSSNQVENYPKRIKTKKVPTHHISVGIVKNNGKLLITRRKLDGLLGGLWEFPGGKVKKDESPEDACKREIKEETNLYVEIEGHLTRIDHAYTHFKIKMDVFYCSCKPGSIRLNGPIDYRWIHLSEVDQFAFPKANNKFIPLIEKNPV